MPYSVRFQTRVLYHESALHRIFGESGVHQETPRLGALETTNAKRLRSFDPVEFGTNRRQNLLDQLDQ